VTRGIATTDLSGHMSRTRPTSARHQSFDQLIDALSFDGAPSIEGARSLLIVDDYFVTGRTAAALLSVLRSHGFPPDGQVTVACPLWLDRSGAG
jgi:predicted amidophosphoribosyltransferase